MSNIFERLAAAHRLVNREIRREISYRLPDQARLLRLKKARLAIKDRLTGRIPPTETTLRFVKSVLAPMQHARA